MKRVGQLGLPHPPGEAVWKMEAGGPKTRYLTAETRNRSFWSLPGGALGEEDEGEARESAGSRLRPLGG